MIDIQKANLWKRIAAWMVDGIATFMIAVGLGLLLSAALNYEGYSSELTAAYEKYAEIYDIDLNITQEEYQAMSSQEQQRYQQAQEALQADEDVLYLYDMMMSLLLVILTVSVLVAIVAVEFVVPLCLKHGRTLGKKVFGLSLMRQDGVRVTPVQLFVRTMLGKFTVETMIPVYLILMIFMGSANMLHLAMLAGLAIAQLVILGATKNRAQIHDLFAGTVVVDFDSQQIFDSHEALIAYKNQMHAEQAARQTY